MAATSIRASTRRARQAELYASEMGEEALKRQLVERKERHRYTEPDECNCSWKGSKARSLGTHHSVTCPRFRTD